MKIHQAVVAISVSSLFATAAWPITPADVARLGQDLTATGAEKAYRCHLARHGAGGRDWRGLRVLNL